MVSIDDRYYQTHPKSAEFSAEAETLFPDGVTHDGRKSLPFRVYMDRGLGPKKWDIDGNEYIDYRTGHGSMILGQAHPEVVKAVQERMAKGTHLSASTQEEVKWASIVKQLVPYAEKMRFQSSGTEAMMMTFRMARAYSGKSKIVKFENAFHGWGDSPFVGATGDNPNNGIPSTVRDSMVVIPYDINELERVLDNDNDIAGVVFQGNHVINPTFIRGLRDVTKTRGVILIFDEVVSGFRYSKSGCGGRYGVEPDISGWAKILAGGLPGGCVLGRADIIDMISPGKITHPGTFNANPLSAAAGSTALNIVANQPIVEIAEERAVQLKNGLNQILTKMEIPGCAYGVSSIVSMRLGIEHECDREYCEEAEQAMMVGVSNDVDALLVRALTNEGVWGGPTGYILSATHTEEDINNTLDKFERAIAQVRDEGAI